MVFLIGLDCRCTIAQEVDGYTSNQKQRQHILSSAISVSWTIYGRFMSATSRLLMPAGSSAKRGAIANVPPRYICFIIGSGS